jgi:predicted kinase
MDQERFQKLIASLIMNKAVSDHNALVLLMGLPYSGKSTIAEKLAADGFIHIWATKLKKEYQLTDNQMLDLAKELTTCFLSRGFNVVFDFLNHTNAIRQPFIDIAKNLDKPFFVFNVNTPIEEIYQRQERNQRSGDQLGRSIISKAVIEEIRQETQLPGGLEFHEIQSFDDI